MNFIEPWNDPTILPPPINTFRVSYKIDVQDLKSLCNNVVQILSRQSPLHKESALLSRFLYKFDKKFRNDIGYRHFKMLNTALKRYLLINLLKDVENFTGALPVGNENYLPSRQMLEYILVRIMTFAKIMVRICVCSKQASIFYMDRVKRGESHWMSLMPYALLSRIWSISSILLQHSCTWYSGLHPYTSKLIVKGIDFLPANYSLPTDFGKWIDLENIEDYGRFEWSHKKDISVAMILPEDEFTFDTILDYVNDINLIESKNGNGHTKPVPQEADLNIVEKEVDPGETIPRKHAIPFSSVITAVERKENELDLGEKVPRDYFKSFFSKEIPKENKNVQIHCPDNVTSNKSLDSFITTEENYRNENNDLSLTKHLSFMQWQSLKTSLLNLKESIGRNRKIERKFKKIWKEKCSDYK